MLTSGPLRLFPLPRRGRVTPVALWSLLLVSGCTRVGPADPVELIDQACCSEANSTLTEFKGCVLSNRECNKKHKWWMRGQVSCTAVDEANCSGERCCHYRPQYDASIGEPDPDWTPPGFPKPEHPKADADTPSPDADAPSNPAPAPSEPAAAPQPTVQIVFAADGTTSIEGQPLDAAALRTRLCEVAKALPDVAVSVQAGADTPTAAVLPVLEIVKACGIKAVKLEQTTD